MELRHLLEGSQHVVQTPGVCRVADGGFESLAVRLYPGREPERRTAEVGGHVRRAMVEAGTRELPRDHGRSAEVGVRRGPSESRERAGEERGDDRGDHLRRLVAGRTADLGRWTDHLFLLWQKGRLLHPPLGWGRQFATVAARGRSDPKNASPPRAVATPG